MFVFQENLNSVIVCEEEKPIQEVLSLLILLSERVINAAQEAESYKSGNLAIARLVTELSKLLRPLARLATTSATLYDRPIRRVCLDLAKALDRALTFARRCRHERTNFLHQVLSINTAADYKKASTLLDSSLADLRWLLSIYNRDSYDHGTMPPLACTDPILAYVWPAIAALHMGRAEGAQQLADFANNERTKNVIVEEIGIPPLLKMMSESRNVDAQSAAASALCNLVDDQYRMKVIIDERGVEAVVAAMARGPPMRVQLVLVDLVLKMLEMDAASVQEEFGAENVTRLLVALLGVDVDLDEFLELNYPKISSNGGGSSSSRDDQMKMKVSSECSRSEREREAEPPEVKARLKISCAVALWKLARRSLSNSRNITETKALLVLAKIIKKEQGELRENCLKVVMELAVVAESHADLKRSAFKLTSTPAKVVLDQLLKVMNEEKSPRLVVPAVRAVGCLASMFPARERGVVRSLVAQLGHCHHDVAAEAARALSKFVCGQNYNCKEHCEAIIEFGGVPKLMILLRESVRGCFHLEELVLLCNLAVNGRSTGPLEEARVLGALERAAKHAVSEQPDLRELFEKAIHQLVIYQVGVHPHLNSEV